MITSIVAIPARLDTHHIFSVDKFYWEGSQTRPHFTLRLRELRCRGYRSVPLGKDTTKLDQTEALAIERELGKKARYGGGVFSERWQ